MKKITLMFLALIILMTVNAQESFLPKPAEHQHEHEGRVFLGGAVTFWNDTEDKTILFDLCPEVGYLFNNTWGIGLLLGYEYEKEKENDAIVRSHAFKVSPFARYYYFHKGPFNLFLDGGFGLNFGKTKIKGISETKHGFEVGIRPGACADLTEGLCLCLRMGFIGYRDNYFAGEEPRIGKNGFGIRFAPEELMIGLELEF